MPKTPVKDRREPLMDHSGTSEGPPKITRENVFIRHILGRKSVLFSWIYRNRSIEILIFMNLCLDLHKHVQNNWEGLRLTIYLPIYITSTMFGHLQIEVPFAHWRRREVVSWV